MLYRYIFWDWFILLTVSVVPLPNTFLQHSNFSGEALCFSRYRLCHLKIIIILIPPLMCVCVTAFGGDVTSVSLESHRVIVKELGPSLVCNLHEKYFRFPVWAWCRLFRWDWCILLLKKVFSINKFRKDDGKVKSPFSNATVVTIAGKIHQRILKNMIRKKIFV